MPFEDTELDFLKEQRDRASRELDEKRRELDSASAERERLKSTYDSQLNYLNGHIPELKTNIAYYREQSQEAYNNREKAAARDYSETAKRYREELNQAYDDKNRMQGELKAAGEQFRTALEAFREAQGEFNQAREAFNKLAYLKEESAKKRAKQEEQRRKRDEWRQSVIFRDGTPFLKDSTCSACSGSGKCPVCQGTGWVSGVSRCDSCYNDPRNGRKYHRCNTCKGTRLEPTTELSKDW